MASAGTGEEMANHFVNLFRELQKDIRNLSDMPLAPRSIDGIDDVFNCAAVLPPRQAPRMNSSDTDNHTPTIPTLERRLPNWGPAH
jgi:hypothetical protein